MFKAMFYLLIHRTLLRRTDNGAGPEGPGKKTSKLGLKESKAQDKNNIISNRIGVSILVIDCY